MNRSPLISQRGSDIDFASASVSYSSFEEGMGKIRQFGVDALMAKADIKAAFRLLPISPEEFTSLAIFFEGNNYYDMCLPMG